MNEPFNDAVALSKDSKTSDFPSSPRLRDGFSSDSGSLASEPNTLVTSVPSSNNLMLPIEDEATGVSLLRYSASLGPSQVLVIIWLNADKKIGGHVSLGTDKHYVSFWPAQPKDEEDFPGRDYYHHKFGADSNASYFRTIDYDIIKKGDEEGKDYLLIVFNCLNVHKINKEIENIITDGGAWVLYGSSFLSPFFKLGGRNNFNCCGITHHLLQVGGARLRTPHLVSDYLYSVALFRKSVFALRNYIKYFSSPPLQYWALAIDLPHIIDDSYGGMWVGTIVDALFFKFNFSPTIILSSASLFFSLNEYFDNSREFLPHYDRQTGRFKKVFYRISNYSVGLYIMISLYILYQRTYTPKNISDMAEFAKKIEKEEVSFLTSPYFKSTLQLKEPSPSTFMLKRKTINNFLSVSNFLFYAYQGFMFAYVMRKDEAKLPIKQAIFLSASVALLHAITSRIFISERRLHTTILTGSGLYLLLSKFSFGQNVLSCLPTNSILTAGNDLLRGALLYLTPVKGLSSSSNNYVGQVINFSSRLFTFYPLVPLVIAAMYWFSDSYNNAEKNTKLLLDENKDVEKQVDKSVLSEIVPGTNLPVHFTEEIVDGKGDCGPIALGARRDEVVNLLVQAGEQGGNEPVVEVQKLLENVKKHGNTEESWCRFFYNCGKKIASKSIQYGPFVVGTYLVVRAIRDSEGEPLKNLPTASFKN